MSGHDLTTFMQVATGIMVLVVAVAGLLRREALEVFGAGAVVALFTIASRIITLHYDPPWSVAHYPAQDAVCVVLVWSMWLKERSWWKTLLGVIFTLQCAAHVVYWGAFFAQGFVTRDQTVSYLWAINPLFVASLAVLTLAGGGHVLGYLRDLHAGLPVFGRSLLPHRSDAHG